MMYDEEKLNVAAIKLYNDFKEFVNDSNDNPFFLSPWLVCSAYEGFGANPRDPPARGYLSLHYNLRGSPLPGLLRFPL